MQISLSLSLKIILHKVCGFLFYIIQVKRFDLPCKSSELEQLYAYMLVYIR